MLEKSIVPVAMTQGMDTKGDPKQLPLGKFDLLTDAVFLKNGEIRKCYGYDSTAVTGNINSVATLKDTLFYLTDDDAWTFSGSLSKYDKVGRYARVKVEKLNAVNRSDCYAQTSYDSINQVLMHVWEAPAGSNTALYYSVVDARDNTVIFSTTQLVADGRQPHIVTESYMDYFLITYYVEIGSVSWQLKATAISKTNYTDITTITITPSNNYNPFGATKLFASSGFACAAFSSTTTLLGDTTTLCKFPNNKSSFAAPTLVTLASSCSRGVDIQNFNSTDLMIGLADSTNLKTIVYNSSLVVINALRTIATASAGTSFYTCVLSSFTTNAHIFTTVVQNDPSKLNLPKVVQAIVTGTTTTTALRDFLMGACIAGNAIGSSDKYLPVKLVQSSQIDDDSNISQGIFTLYLIEFYNVSYGVIAPFNNYVAAKFYDLNATSFALSGDQANFINFVEGVKSFLPCYFGLIAEPSGNSSLCTISFSSTKPILAELANNLHVTGGYLGMFDGQQFAEHNFLQYPLKMYMDGENSGNIEGGTYLYTMTYQWVDATGQLHESSPSDPVEVQHSGSKQIILLGSYLKITNRTDNIFISIYRSNDGILYYQLPGSGYLSSLINNKSQNTFAFIDNNSQTSLEGRPLLYTVGGEVNNACPPACTFVGVYKRRLIAVPSEDSNSIWFSKDIIPPTAGAIGTPVNFANEFVKSVDEKGGPITGTIQLDDKLLIFKKDTISVMVGEGPANNGLQDDFTTPQLIVSDTGCLYGRSLVIMPLGAMFQSPKGWYLCDRSLSVSYIGAPVENYNALMCNSADLMVDRNEVWFTSNTYAFVYNYYFNQWSLIYIQGADACIYQNRWLGVNFNSIYKENFTFQRNGVGYPMYLRTGWISLAQVQGFQRIYRMLIMGDYKSRHKLQVQVSYNFNNAITQTSTITASSGIPPYQWQVYLAQQKCTAIRFIIQDLAPDTGSYSESFAISNIAFLFGIKKGLNKRPAANSVG